MGSGSSMYRECEEEGSGTPRLTRILPKDFDPRSPSEGITRTPIEVNFEFIIPQILCK